MTKNKMSRRKEADPVWRRMYLLGKIEGTKAKLMQQIAALPPEQGAKEIDTLVADAFAPKAKAAKAKA